MGLLVDLARDILKNAELLEQQLEQASQPQPSFEAGTPASYPPESKHPEVFETRHAIINASKAVHDLALGPSDVLQYITGAERLYSYAFRVIEYYDIAHHVPKNGSITFADLAVKLEVNQEILERIMRFAFSARMFQEKPVGAISHNAISEAIPSLSGWSKMLLTDDFAATFQAWPQALKVYDEANGAKNLPWNMGNDDERSFFARLSAQSGEIGMKGFTWAMESRTKVSGGSDMSFFLQGFDWASLGTGPLVDVAGGSGHVTVPIAKDFPDLHVIVQDLPSNADAAAAQISAAGVADRVTFQAQDFFEPQPQGLQPKAYFLKSILHDWNDEDCIRILKPLLPGMEKGARLFTMDRVAYLPGEGKVPSHQDSMGQFMDLMMWSLLGAKERNLEQWKALATKVDPRLKILYYRTLVGCDWGMCEWGF
jgi:6-hydroxytryprostatin B O-methyltransferase